VPALLGLLRQRLGVNERCFEFDHLLMRNFTPVM